MNLLADESVAAAIRAHGTDLPQAFAVITAGAIRIRRPESAVLHNLSRNCVIL